MNKKLMRGTTSTYIDGKGKATCDLVALAKHYVRVGNVPERVGFSKACEIALLAEAFLILYKGRKLKK